MARDAASTELIGGRFRLLRRLGRGSTGEVHVAWDESTGQQFALKRLLLQAGGRTSAANFMREFHALSTLRHPRIIEVYHYGVHGEVPYYTMEFLDGHDLSELSPLPYREACSYLRDIALSLALLHDRRLLHRDVSPRNVLRTKDGRCKLIDFGAMTPFGTPSTMLGTPPCLAPEAFQGGALDQRTDLYSLGAIAYFALTGGHAYPTRELGALPALWSHGAQSPIQRGCEVPRALDELVMSLLSADPVQRPASAAEVIDRLSAIGGLTQEDELAIGRSCLASTPLLGRTRERAQLFDSLRKTKEASGSALWVSGDPGSGTTRMLTEASLIAQTCGLAVMRVTLREQRGVSSSLARDLVTGLMQVVPEEAERAGNQHPLLQPLVHGAPVEVHGAELLRQVDAFVCEIADRQPLLLTFDDVHHGTETDLALIAALAYRTSSRALCVIGSEHSVNGSLPLTSVSDIALHVRLRALDRAQVAMLSSALFGDVPNLECVSDFFYRNAQGNPKLTLELAEHLLARGALSYVAGSWMLPDHIDESMASDMAQRLKLRLESIGEDARTLLELLCIRRRGASTEQLLELAAPLSGPRVFHALEELVRVGVLESAGVEYAFAQEALRAELSRSLPQSRSQQLHQRWAQYLLSHGANDDSRLEAGWHLVNTPDELAGAKLLVQVAPELVERRVNLAAAVPALERALEVYERHAQPLRMRLRLRALLVMSSYLYDHRLARRYADQTLDLLYPFTGLREAERCARWLGRRVGFVAGMAWASLRRLLRRPSQRGPHVLAALKYYGQSTMGLMGLRALLLEDTRAVLDRMRAFEGSPFQSLSLIYEMANAIHSHSLGRGSAADQWIKRAKARLEGKPPWMLTAQEHLDIMIGLLLLQGMNESLREHSRALECASKLERIATPLAIAASMRIRMTYYLLRGNASEAQHQRRLLELQALESGSFWQVQWFAVPLEGLAAATWHDLLGLRRALGRLEQLAAESPGMEQMHLATRIHYYFHRGEYELTACAGDEYMRLYPPLERLGWGPIYAITALAHAYLGRPERGIEICRMALAQVSSEDRDYFVVYAPIEAAYATALGLAGQAAESREVFRANIERLRAAGEYLRAIVTHHHRVRVARIGGDPEALQVALADMRQTAVDSANPAAVELAERLSEDRRSYSPSEQEQDAWWTGTERI
ncbi:MAG TPA: protein kinase [Polyangiales bacterium]|nr:protein kinase [Polyangiales bacterium]